MDVDTSKKEEEIVKDVPLATVSEVFSFMETQTKVYLVLGTISACIGGCCLPLTLFYFSEVMGDISALSSEGLGPIVDVVYAMMILGVVSMVFDTLNAGFFETAANEMTLNFKKKWFEAVIRQDMTYFDIRDVSETVTIISTNGEKFKTGVSKKLGHGIQYFCTVCCGFGLAFYASWKVSLTVLATVPVVAGSTGWLLRLNQTKSARDSASYAKAGGIVYQVASNIRTVLALNAGEEMIERFTNATSEAYEGAISQLIYLGLANGMLMGSFMLGYFVVVGYGSYLLYNEVKENGCDPSGAVSSNTSCSPDGSDIFLALMGIVFAGAVIPQISNGVEAFTGARAACFPAILAMSRKSETGDDRVDASNKKYRDALIKRSVDAVMPKYDIDVTSLVGQKPSSVSGTIEFRDVRFSYPTRQEVNVFNGFNLKIEAGKTVALVGPSGSGKSTVVQLIERYYDPVAGSVTLDGMDLKDLNVKWLRSHVGLVSQEPTLFATTIKENIRIAKPEATDREVEEAARQANAHDFISSLQDGYDTFVGDKGAQLSGGQKQRIAIARTLITNPQVILLDEATSALDSESEAVVQEALDVIMAKGEVTVVVIAHRLSTIKNADMIAVVSDGKVVESGTHDELISKGGKYFDLVQAQKGKAIQREDSLASTTTETVSESDSNAPSRNASEQDLTKYDDEEGPVDVANRNDGVIVASNVHFSYPSRPANKIFRGLGLEVHEGETLAIVGPSGQGKSTVIQLIEEFYRPSKGRIFYSGDDTADLNVRWYRNELGLVSQEPTLFDGTIAENIKFGMPGASQQDIEEAAMKANAHQFISEFPDGYNTSVGTSSSSQISGGQKQRIAIARALLRKPRVLLLDEATSALDSESEKVVQEALDHIMKDSKLITIVIAHRLSTIRGADKIAYIDHGKVREIGTYDELMAKPHGHYRRLEELQTLGDSKDRSRVLKAKVVEGDHADEVEGDAKSKGKEDPSDMSKATEVDEAVAKRNEQKAKELAVSEWPFFLFGSVGALMNGITFPGQGLVFAYMIEVLYHFTLPCEEGKVPDGFSTCQEYWNDAADEMKDLAVRTLWLNLGLFLMTVIGNMMMFQGFGTATERINKRVRDKAFKALIRQEVGWFDTKSVGQITTQLSDDAAMIHAFSGEPIRTFMMSISSVGAGLVVSFFFMWEFAFIALGILPFMAFGEYVQALQVMGTDEGNVARDAKESSEGAIVVESLINIRIVAALCMEDQCISKYTTLLEKKNSNNHWLQNAFHNIGLGLGEFFQNWGYALMFYFGSWCMQNRGYDMRDYLIALFGLMLSLTGLATAMAGLTDVDKAKAAAVRIFDLIERESEIDPLSEKGKIQSPSAFPSASC